MILFGGIGSGFVLGFIAGVSKVNWAFYKHTGRDIDRFLKEFKDES